MRKLTATEPDGHLDLVAILEEGPHVIRLKVEIMLGNLGLHANLFEFGNLGTLFCIFYFLFLLKFELAIIEQPAHRRNRLRRNFHKVEPCFPRNTQCLESGYDPSLFSMLIDQTHFSHTDLLVDPQIFLCQLASSAVGPLLLTGGEKPPITLLSFRQLKGAAYITILIPRGKAPQECYLPILRGTQKSVPSLSRVVRRTEHLEIFVHIELFELVARRSEVLARIELFRMLGEHLAHHGGHRETAV